MIISDVYIWTSLCFDNDCEDENGNYNADCDEDEADNTENQTACELLVVTGIQKLLHLKVM
mgnify:CR=1 FL=1